MYRTGDKADRSFFKRKSANAQRQHPSSAEMKSNERAKTHRGSSSRKRAAIDTRLHARISARTNCRQGLSVQSHGAHRLGQLIRHAAEIPPRRCAPTARRSRLNGGRLLHACSDSRFIVLVRSIPFTVDSRCMRNPPQRSSTASEDKAKTKNKKQPKYKLAWLYHERTRMEIAAYLSGTVSALAVIFLSLFFSLGHRDVGYWLTCIAAIFLLIACFCWGQDQLWKKDIRYAASIAEPADPTNVLVPDNRPIPHLSSYTPPIPDSAVIVLLGDRVSSYAASFPHVVFFQGDEPMMTLGKENGGLWLSAKVFDEHGMIICELVKNRFHLNHNNIFRTEITPHRLVVFDNAATKVLDIDFLNPRGIQIYANYYLRNGGRAIMDGSKVQLGQSEFVDLNFGNVSLKVK